MSTASKWQTRMVEDKVESKAEQEYFARHGWCLNPLQPLERLLVLLRDELECYPRLEAEWQREETRINLYLLSCAIGCTVADGLPPRIPSLAKLERRWPWARLGLRAASAVANAAHYARNLLLDGEVNQWQQAWQRCIDLSCEILLNDLGAESAQAAQLWALSSDLTSDRLPGWLRRMRMQIPSGFRAQELTHQDAIALADGFDGRYGDDGRGSLGRGTLTCGSLAGGSQVRGTLAIVGARTAGVYMAPLIEARLRQRGWESSWTGVRPKSGLSCWEKRWLCTKAARASRVLLVDDYPDTGETVRMMIELLEKCGVERRKITVMVPGHEAQREQRVLTGGHEDVDLVTLTPEEQYKQKLLGGDGLRSWLEEVAASQGATLFDDPKFDDPKLFGPKGAPADDGVDDEETRAINQRLAAERHDDYLTKLKRVYTFRRGGQSWRVLAKGVGWGWLGYHAYLTGSRMQEFVPPVLGLRHGILLSEWIETEAGIAAQAAADGQPGAAATELEVAERIAIYTAERVKRLSLVEAEAQSEMTAEVTGCYTLARLLRGVYPPYLRWLKMPALWRQLQGYETASPVFVDGNLRAGKWLSDGALSNGPRVLKIDYEHHGFGNPAPNVVDAAYDLALAAMQWKFSAEAEDRMLEEYCRLTGDHGAGERVALYKLVCGQLAAELARFKSCRARSHEDAARHEAEHIEACNYLTYSMARFCAREFGRGRSGAQLNQSPLNQFEDQPGNQSMDQGGSREWRKRLFFLDLDGCFDRACFIFPHTTARGMAALHALERHGWDVVLNTGRAVGHVRQYCMAYGAAGGVAEYGCVFVDRLRGRETVLIDAASREALGEVRARLMEQSGVYLDPTYEVAIRAYGLENGRALGLSAELLQEVLGRYPLLTYIASPVDTYIIPVAAGKGSSTRWVMNELGVEREATAAMGDSESDLPMLESVGRGWLPSNAAQGVALEARRRGLRVLSGKLQRGLLQAVEELAGEAAVMGNAVEKKPRGREHILRTLLAVSDRTALEHCMGALRRDRL